MDQTRDCEHLSSTGEMLMLHIVNAPFSQLLYALFFSGLSWLQDKLHLFCYK